MRKICIAKTRKRPAKIGRTANIRACKRTARVRIFLTFLAASLWITSPAANASELIYSQYSDGQSVYGPSLVWPADAVNSEVADEFNVVANIDRVSAGGSVWGPVDFQGVHIRFYEFGADNKPGALQHEYFWRPAIQA